MGRITEHVIRALKANPPSKGNRVEWDAEVMGFGARVTSLGSVSFVLRYVQRGRERRLTIAKHPDLSPAAARQIAIELRGDIARGADPLARREEGHRQPTVSAFCERYLKEHAEVRKKPSSVAEDERLIEKRIKPAIGAFRLDSVARSDVIHLHNGLVKTPYEANRTLALLSKMFNLAEVWGVRPDGSNPCRHVKKFAEAKRNGALSPNEVARLGEALRTAARNGSADKMVIALLFFLLLTGCRLSEARLLQWPWIDWDANAIRFPDSKTGAKTHHFGDGARALLEKLRRAKQSNSAFVFPARKDEDSPMPTPTIEHAWRRIRDRAGLEGKRIHDFRHTRGSWAAAEGANAFLVRDALSHKNVGTTDRYVQLEATPLKKLNDNLDDRILSILTGHDHEPEKSQTSSSKSQAA